ncbi:MAG TPA: hypothetical protein VFU10_10220 [Gaiellaceae bacterium]|nr:hypothetical protein [Gaiellaceae bacterium]
MRAAALAVVLAAAAAPAQPQWHAAVHVPGIVDVVRLPGGAIAVSTRTGLFRVVSTGLTPFAQTYKPTNGGEQYATAVAPTRTATCAWNADDVFVLDASGAPGIFRVPRDGVASRFFDFPQGSFPSGITWDAGGRFGHRLLVTVVVKNATTLYAVDCRGRGAVLGRGGPRVEGGIVVAPRSFGRFGGRLIAASELTGIIYAFDPRGHAAIVARPRARSGPDLGVESLGFAPAGVRNAYLADLGAPGAPTEGTDSLLVLRPNVKAGTLVAATEGGATTIAVRCARVCTSRRIADGPAATHAEGHVVFGRIAS